MYGVKRTWRFFFVSLPMVLGQRSSFTQLCKVFRGLQLLEESSGSQRFGEKPRGSPACVLQTNQVSSFPARAVARLPGALCSVRFCHAERNFSPWVRLTPDGGRGSHNSRTAHMSRLAPFEGDWGDAFRDVRVRGSSVQIAGAVYAAAEDLRVSDVRVERVPPKNKPMRAQRPGDMVPLCPHRLGRRGMGNGLLFQVRPGALLARGSGLGAGPRRVSCKIEAHAAGEEG